MKHLLVPTNFLDYANNAAEYALKFALDYGARITLFHTYHIPVVDPLVPTEYLAEMATSAEKNALDKMQELKELLKAEDVDNKVSIDYECTMGFAADEIIGAAERLGADMILMGTRHVQTVQRILVGSVMGAVLTNSKVPVLVVPANVTGFYPIRNIAFASQYNDVDDIKFINKAMDFARSLGAKLSCVHIELKDEEVNETAKLVAIKDEYVHQEQMGLISFENIQAEDIVDGLAQYIAYHNVDMTVMVTHKRSFLQKIFDRSLTKKMAFQTNVPLIAFHD
ncbi:MAG: universal stress protein [Chitinophagales bacterium]|nr:universal stress protein [Chitinophagales bacterium]